MTTKLRRCLHHVEHCHNSPARVQRHQSRLIGAIFLGGVMLVSAIYAGPGLARESVVTVGVDGAAASRGLLDGQSFAGPTGTLGMGSDHLEKVLFVDGKFRSLACEKWGFEQREYRAQRVGDAVRFEAIHVSADYGTMTWQGTVRNGKLEARYVWEKQRLFWNTRREYWFKGDVSEAGHESYHAF